jgi:hypothetical protein
MRPQRLRCGRVPDAPPSIERGPRSDQCRAEARRGQRNGQRIAAQNYKGDQPPDCPLAVRVGADQLGHVADGLGLVLDLPFFGAQGGAFGLEIGEDYALSTTLVMSGTGVSRGVRHQCSSPALLTEAVALAYG